MKRFNFAAIVAASAILLTGCSDEQSFFNVDSVPGRCVIEGTVTYNEGTSVENGTFAYNYKPAANLEVVVTVPNSSYGNNLKGNSTFTTTTDENGKYSIEIPATDNAVKATIRTADFRGVRQFVTRENNKVVTKSEEVSYFATDQVDVHARGIEFVNMTCTECSVNSSLAKYGATARVTGQIGQNAWNKVDAEAVYNDNYELVRYNNARLEPCFVAAPNAALIVTVNYENHDFTYNTTTDGQGKFNLYVPVIEFPAQFSYSIEALPYDGQFVQYEAVQVQYQDRYGYDKEYTDYQAHTLTGFYAQPSNWSNFASASLPVAGQIANNNFKLMLFNTINNGSNTYGYHATAFTQGNAWFNEL